MRQSILVATYRIHEDHLYTVDMARGCMGYASHTTDSDWDAKDEKPIIDDRDKITALSKLQAGNTHATNTKIPERKLISVDSKPDSTTCLRCKREYNIFKNLGNLEACPNGDRLSAHVTADTIDASIFITDGESVLNIDHADRRFDDAQQIIADGQPGHYKDAFYDMWRALVVRAVLKFKNVLDGDPSAIVDGDYTKYRELLENIWVAALGTAYSTGYDMQLATATLGVVKAVNASFLRRLAKEDKETLFENSVHYLNDLKRIAAHRLHRLFEGKSTVVDLIKDERKKPSSSPSLRRVDPPRRRPPPPSVFSSSDSEEDEDDADASRAREIAAAKGYDVYDPRDTRRLVCRRCNVTFTPRGNAGRFHCRTHPGERQPGGKLDCCGANLERSARRRVLSRGFPPYYAPDTLHGCHLADHAVTGEPDVGRPPVFILRANVDRTLIHEDAILHDDEVDGIVVRRLDVEPDPAVLANIREVDGDVVDA